jgi:hypothetical protein
VLNKELCGWVHMCKYPCHNAFSFSCIFHEKYILIQILTTGTCISMFFVELWGGVCRHEYQCHVSTSHSTIIVSIWWAKLYFEK